jgi:acetyltransferase-like isoleucine patch superfamily enzyme
MSDFFWLWTHRERPTNLQRIVIVWAKRFVQLIRLLKILFKNWRMRHRGACIGARVSLGHAKIRGNMRLLAVGDECSLGRCEISVNANVRIGSRVVINDGVVLLTASHDVSMPDWPTTLAPIEIDDFAWIASNAILLPGAKIGRGSVVGAGAVVRGVVAPGAIVLGNPACPIERTRGVELRYSPVLRTAPFEAWVGHSREAAACV